MSYAPIISDVQLVVARHFGLQADDVRSKGRTKTTAYARHLVAFIAHEELGLSYPEIARASQRDHTTALHSVRKVRQLLATRDPATLQHMAELLRDLGLPLGIKEAA